MTSPASSPVANQLFGRLAAAGFPSPTRREFPASFSNALLREAIKNNWVSFPAQTPCFAGNASGGLHWRIAQLYFVSGWSVGRICLRHRLSKQMVRNILSQWRLRAVAAGFVQEIQPES